MDRFIVTEDALRPARMDGSCFYCSSHLGTEHKHDCVLLKRRVRLQMTIEYDVFFPASWSIDEIEYHRNEGSWCADNAIAEIQNISDVYGCLCSNTRFKVLEAGEDIILKEG